MNATEKVIPNSFQNPNAYVDRAMELLTGDEFKVLSFATRHIFGWKDKLNRGCAPISLTMLEHGYVTESGVRYGGTGLSRPSLVKILSSLCQFKLLVKEATGKDGDVFSLGEMPDWGAMETRAAEKAEAARQRMEKVREKRTTGKRHLPVNDINQQQLTAFTATGKRHLLKQTHIQTQSQTQKEKEKELFSISGVPDNPPISIPSQDELLAIADPAEQKATAEALFSALVAKVSPPQKQPFTDDEIQAQVAIAIARQKARQNAAEVQV